MANVMDFHVGWLLKGLPVWMMKVLTGIVGQCLAAAFVLSGSRGEFEPRHLCPYSLGPYL